MFGLESDGHVSKEILEIQRLFERLCHQPRQPFPARGRSLNAPRDQGVYVIRKGRVVFHVGRTIRARQGLLQRLRNHLQGRSSFTRLYFNRDGARLRNGFTYQTLVVRDTRLRALLESYAMGRLCPRHIGTGGG